MGKAIISADTVVSSVTDIMASDIDGGTVMMSIENGKYYGLDNVGSSIWSLLREPIRVNGLIDELLLKFDVDRETCARDVLVFLECLNNDGLLKIDDRA